MSLDVNAAGTSLQVSGQLRDDMQQGLPQRRVHVLVTRAGEVTPVVDERVYTGRRGGFELQKHVAPGTYQIHVEFPENDHVTAAVATQNIEVLARPVELKLQVPSFVVPEDEQGRRSAVSIAIHAAVESIGVRGTAIVYVNESEVAHAELDRYGRAALDVAAALQEGVNVIKVVIPASEHRSEVSIDDSVTVSRDVEVTAKLRRVISRFERGVAVEGAALSPHGPLRDVAVAVTWHRDTDMSSPVAEQDAARAAPSAQVRTDALGRYRSFVASAELGDGRWRAQVQVLPEVGRLAPVTSELLEVDQASSRRILNIAGLLTLLAGLVFLIRRGIGRVRTWLRARREKIRQERRRVEAFEDVDILKPIELAADDGRPASGARERLFEFGGQVWDTWRQRPLAGAELLVTAQDGTEHRLVTDSQGRFGRKRLDVGDYELRVMAPGFMEGNLQFQVPHTGVLANFRVDLVSVALKIRRLYQAMVESVQGEDLWGRLSPREIEEVIWQTLCSSQDYTGAEREREDLHRRIEELAQRSGDGAVRSADLLEAMTELVEDTYFSGRNQDERVWQVARKVALRLTQAAQKPGPTEDA